MKKIYLLPTTKAVELENFDLFLSSSFVDIGGTTDWFDAKERDGLFDDEEEEDLFFGV